MTYSYVDHSTLTPDDLTLFEHLLAHRTLPYHSRREDCPGPEDPWELVIYSARHHGDGTLDERLCYFRRRAEPADGAQHTHFVEMYFTPDGHALPGYEPADQPAHPHIKSSQSGQLPEPPAPHSRPRHRRPR
ncbi:MULTISPECIES: hypothetical protein [unclassified Streptomyces]|uniref:hypothetical protein n=1 Tax=unclassified Streptomyces TaxID=2593676 RepID=UPI00331B2FBE